MKQPKKLTYEHKKYLTKCNRDPDLWALLSEDQDHYIYVNKINGSTLIRNKRKGD